MMITALTVGKKPQKQTSPGGENSMHKFEDDEGEEDEDY